MAEGVEGGGERGEVVVRQVERQQARALREVLRGGELGDGVIKTSRIFLRKLRSLYVTVICQYGA